MKSLKTTPVNYKVKRILKILVVYCVLIVVCGIIFLSLLMVDIIKLF